MKIRKDFVTNSSSANYILAYKDGEWNDKQKEAVLRFVKELICGKDTITKENIDSFYLDNDMKKEVQRAWDEGKTVTEGTVMFDDAEYSLADIYHDLMKELSAYSDGNFEILDGDLSY